MKNKEKKAPTGVTLTPNALLTIATAQRHLIVAVAAFGLGCVLFVLIGVYAKHEIPYILYGAVLLQIIPTYSLALALKRPSPAAWAVATFLFGLGLIFQCILNHKATKALKAAGIKVGVLEATKEDLTKIAANDDISNFEYGVGKQNRGDVDGAIADYGKVIQLNPFHVDAYVNRGLARRVKGDLDGAIEDFTSAIQLKPDFAYAYNTRAAVKKVKGDAEGAEADQAKAQALKTRP